MLSQVRIQHIVVVLVAMNTCCAIGRDCSQFDRKGMPCAFGVIHCVVVTTATVVVTATASQHTVR